MKNKKLILYILILIIIFGIFLRIGSLNKDFSSEEVDFVLAAKAISKIGHPVYYQAEQAPKTMALWHPPMYIYILSIITFFSNNESYIRFLNLFFSVLTALLIYSFCTRFFPEYNKISGLLASALFLINFYVLSSSLLIDIDALSMFFVFSFLFSTILFFHGKKFNYAFLSVISLLFSFANRWPIALVVYLSIFVYILFNKKIPKNILLNYFLIGISAGVIFLIFWSIYSCIIEPGNFFSFIQHNASLSGQQFQSISRYGFSFLLNISQIIRLFTLPALILFFIAIFSFSKKNELKYRMVLLYTLSILLLFLIVPRPAFGYPRYFLTMTPGFFIIISIYLCETFKNFNLNRKKIILILFLLITSTLLLIVFKPQLTLYRNDGLIRATNLPDLLLNIFCSLPLLIFISKKYRKKQILTMGLIVLFFSYNLYFDISYVFNNSRIKEVSSYIKNNTSSEERIIVPKAIGFYSERRFYANDFYKPPMDNLSTRFIVQYIEGSYKDRLMENNFFWGSDIYGGTDYHGKENVDNEITNSSYLVLNYKNLNLNLEKKIGNYYIYKL